MIAKNAMVLCMRATLILPRFMCVSLKIAMFVFPFFMCKSSMCHAITLLERENCHGSLGGREIFKMACFFWLFTCDRSFFLFLWCGCAFYLRWTYLPWSTFLTFEIYSFLHMCSPLDVVFCCLFFSDIVYKLVRDGLDDDDQWWWFHGHLRQEALWCR